MFLVIWEGRRHRDPVGAFENLYVHPETIEHRVDLPIERSHGEPINQVNPFLRTCISGDAYEMIDKVETDLEAVAVIDRDTAVVIPRRSR